MPKRVRAAATLFLVSASLAVASPALAERYGLVVGIDAYTAPIPALQGAVNDAKDVAGALQKTGVKELILLTDQQATKPAIMAAWTKLLDEAQAGDTIIFTYAGHGSQEPAPNDPDQPKGYDNTLPLVDYGLKGPAIANRIVDREVDVMLRAAEAKKVFVIFVADACHSGTMYRTVSLGLTYRFVQKPKIDRDELMKFAPPGPPASKKIGEHDAFTFLAGVADDRLVPEIQIAGQSRGALSYSFARALEGAADADHNGATTEQELVAYIRANVLQLTESQQIAQSFPAVSRQIEVIQNDSAKPQPDMQAAIAGAIAATQAAPISLAYRGGEGPATIEGATIVGDETTAELIYDVAKRTVEKRVAGVVAEDVAPEGLAGIVAKWRAIAVLKAAAGQSIVPFEVTSGPRTYSRGEDLVVGLGAATHPYLTVFNLPPNGRVELLYPLRKGERETDQRTTPFVMPFEVKDPPFGAEHLIAILSDAPLDGLQAALSRMTSPNASVDLPVLLKTALSGQSISIGMAGVFTSGGK